MSHRFVVVLRRAWTGLLWIGVLTSLTAQGFWSKWSIERQMNQYQKVQRLTETELHRLLARVDQSFYLPMFDGERHLLIRLFTKAYRKYLVINLKIEHLMRKIRGNPSKYSQWFHMEIDQVGERASFYFREEYLFSKREVWQLVQYHKRFPELVDYASLIYYIYTSKRLPKELDEDEEYRCSNICLEDYEPSGLNLYSPGG